jgi:hydrogenase nickel incorporation protein HypA/HybF
MHEVSVAEGLLATAVAHCLDSGYSRIETVRIRIGKASGVMPEALLFAFDAMKDGTIASDAALEIETVRVAGNCSSCHLDFSVEDNYVLCCPVCGGTSFTVHSGRELDITELEVV